MKSIKYLTPEQFRKMQLTELDMLVDFDRVCRKNNINYVLFGGSLIGAVRHKGYIPWDDDADIAMLREDYDCFKKCINELNPEICFFQDHDTDPDYRWGYGKLRRTGTKYVRVGQEHLKCKTGIFVDVFPLDDVPKHLMGQILQDWHCFFLRKILWSEVAKNNMTGFWRIWFTILSKIPLSIRIAAGERLDLRQKDIRINGHAIECRINAEDPDRGFAPSPGKLVQFIPAGGPQVRMDTHVYAGYMVPPYYDSLLGKLIAWGRDRTEALAVCRRALDEMVVEGVKTTIPFQKRIIAHKNFSGGKYDTGFVERLMQERRKTKKQED